MATKKAKAGLPVKLAAQDPVLLKNIITIADLATTFGGEAPVASVTDENMDKAVEVLARVREAGRKLDELHKLAVAKLKKEIKVYDDEKKTIMKRLEAADVSVAKGIIAQYRVIGAEAFDRRQVGSLGSSATMVPNGYTVEVTDADLVPDEFVLPAPPRSARINTAAIAEVIKAGGKVAGVNAEPKYYITTRAAETIKKVGTK